MYTQRLLGWTAAWRGSSQVRERKRIPDAAAVHDALCVAYVINPTVLTDLRHCHVEIGLAGYGEGQTIVDQRAYPLKKNGYFAYDADRFKFVDILCDCFARDPLKA